MRRNYWLNTHKDISWQKFLDQGDAKVTGFPNNNWETVKKIQVGDYILCYQAGDSCWIGLLEVIHPPFYLEGEPFDEKYRIWHDVEFRSRVAVKILINLTPKTGIPLVHLVDKFDNPNLSYWYGFLRNHPRKMSTHDSKIIVHALEEQIAAQDILAQKIEEGDQTVLTGLEGQRKQIYVNSYERDSALRAKAVRIHGTTCKGCGFNFGAMYGARGEGYIEVHHLKPLSSFSEETHVNPEEDMTVLCANCHRMIHRNHNEVLTLPQLRELIKS